MKLQIYTWIFGYLKKCLNFFHMFHVQKPRAPGIYGRYILVTLPCQQCHFEDAGYKKVMAKTIHHTLTCRNYNFCSLTCHEQTTEFCNLPMKLLQFDS